MVFWTKCIVSNLLRTKRKLLPIVKSSSIHSNVPEEDERGASSLVLRKVFSLPFSVVTTVEASDWSVQVRMSPTSLQSKGPVVRGVMAACVGHVQWSPLEDHISVR